MQTDQELKLNQLVAVKCLTAPLTDDSCIGLRSH